ncbi:Arc domain-containing protein [Rhizobium leguminosarum bv. trifolii]|uniref:Arc domain-containing protein n=1 Tax=Rhizobium leguminosarum TaxID=384 RepID=UPI00140F5A6F|nr:Arc domain-containing protein [Rhizobium leguminosarum]QIO53400.1 Arc domain-containing protein [Rhizobium leguminosarum bv. trifolii]
MNYRQFKVNIPDEIEVWLAQEAERNMRSKTSEIVLALKEKMHRQASQIEKGSVTA